MGRTGGLECRSWELDRATKKAEKEQEVIIEGFVREGEIEAREEEF